jgi:hypothetical protein
VNIPVHIARPENKAAAELKRVLSQFVLPVAGGTGAVTSGFVIAPQHVQEVSATETSGVVRLTLLVDQQRKRNAGFLAEIACIGRIAESDSRQIGASFAEGLLVLAQLRDVLAAEDSTIVAKEDHHRRLPLPK